ncbi:MAG: bacillithiol system redox-active protein YtxJ [Gelidibacter sp.]
MGIFTKLFSSSSELKEEKQVPWIALTTLSQLDEIEVTSKTKTQAIFKHSTRCGISRMVIKQFESDYNLTNNLDLYYLDLLSYRAISNEIANRFDIVHESPQLILIKNGIVVAQASHSAINALELDRLV